MPKESRSNSIILEFLRCFVFHQRKKESETQGDKEISNLFKNKKMAPCWNIMCQRNRFEMIQNLDVHRKKNNRCAIMEEKDCTKPVPESTFLCCYPFFPSLSKVIPLQINFHPCTYSPCII